MVTGELADEPRGPRAGARPPAWRQVLGWLTLVAAVAIAFLAFQQFGSLEGPAPGQPGHEEFAREQLWDATRSAILGLGAAFSFLGGVWLLRWNRS